jgi:hypothetical protein
LFAGASTDGERLAAAAAMERIRRRLGDAEKRETAIEFRFTLADEWSRRLFVALCRRYGLEPYRYSRQRYTTVMIRAPKSFIEQTLWPEYREIQKALEQYLVDATTRIIREEVYKDSAEARER